MLSLIIKRMIQAIALAIVGDRRQWNQDVIEEENNLGPRMPDDLSLTVIECFGVFWRQTGAMLEGAIHYDRDFPGQRLQVPQSFRQLLGLLLGEALQRRDRDIPMAFEHLREVGLVTSGKARGFLESMFRGHHHQKQEIPCTDTPQTAMDQNMTGDPSLQSPRSHVPSGVSRWIGGERRRL